MWDNSYLENAKVIVICMLFKRTLLDAKIKMAISRIFINSNKFCNNNISKSVVVFSNSASFHTSRFRSLEKEPHIIKSRFEDVPLSKQPFSEFLWSNSEKFSQRTSLVRTWRVCKKKISIIHLINWYFLYWKCENVKIFKYFHSQGLWNSFSFLNCPRFKISFADPVMLQKHLCRIFSSKKSCNSVSYFYSKIKLPRSILLR